MLIYHSLTLLLGTVLAKPVPTALQHEDHIPTEWITDRVTHDVVTFDTVYTNRNLRGLYPVDEDAGDVATDREVSTPVEIAAVGQGGQVAYVANMVEDKLHPCCIRN